MREDAWRTETVRRERERRAQNEITLLKFLLLAFSHLHDLVSLIIFFAVVIEPVNILR